MTKYFCDRCGEETPTYYAVIVSTVVSDRESKIPNLIQTDLCNSCHVEVRKELMTIMRP